MGVAADWFVVLDGRCLSRVPGVGCWGLVSVPSLPLRCPQGFGLPGLRLTAIWFSVYVARGLVFSWSTALPSLASFAIWFVVLSWSLDG